jgi:mannose/fructose-specific phosphotransferase system component IIA
MILKIASKRRAIAAAIVAGLSLPMLVAAYCNVPENYMTTSSSTNSPNQKKVCICHHADSRRTKTLCLPPPAADAHLKQHADTAGPCPTR